MQATIKIPEKLIKVWFDKDGNLKPADVRGSHGGRGSGKTRSFAKMTAVIGYMFGMSGQKGQILCARQYMNSLEDSSLEEVKRAIEDEPFLLDYYEVGEKYIKSKDGNIWYSFAGLDRNISSVKSKGRILICWVDEAAKVTNHAWSVLEPTLREEGEGWNAELWITWNPERKSDAVESYRHSNDPRVIIEEMNWRDNPKFPDKLERQRQRDLKERPDEYDHIWEGAYGNVQGSILGKLVSLAEREGRINDDVMFDYDGAGVELSCDLGFHDTTYFWYWQRRAGGYSVIMCEGQSGWDAQDWIERIREVLSKSKMPLRKIWMPHDARAKTFQSKYSSIEQFVTAFGADKVAIVPQSKKEAQINAARHILKSCEFNKTFCETGLDGLRAWEFKYNEDTQAFSREPVHNWASHPSDAFAYGCQVMAEDDKPDSVEDARYPVQGVSDSRIIVAPLETLWKDVPRNRGRI